MNEEAIISAALSTKEDISCIKDNISQINDSIKAVIEINKNEYEINKKVYDLEHGYFDKSLNILTDINEIDLKTSNQEEIETVETVDTEITSQFEKEITEFEYIQTVTGIFILVSLLLTLGVQLFQTFNKHWR